MDARLLCMIKAFIEKETSEIVIDNSSCIAKSNTTEYWNSQTTYVPLRGEIVVYLDHQKSGDETIPGIKIGDGNAFLIDLPFVSGGTADSIINLINEHIVDQSIHVSTSDRDAWNNKLNCEIVDETLILNRN